MSNLKKYKKDLGNLIATGDLLLLGLLLDLHPSKKEQYKNVKHLVFKKHYERWYSESLEVVRQILPNRTNDFIEFYKIYKRKQIDCSTYTISDYMLGLEVSSFGKIQADGQIAYPKFEQQLSILKAAQGRFESSLFDIKQLVQADIFDSEMETAKELLKKGFLRPAGVVTGVVLEKHLAQVCHNHNIVIKKKDPQIGIYNDDLKNANVFETNIWRLIQRLGDLRNLCCHNKDREPNHQEVSDLIDGTEKIIKTIY